jgi:hypothetical protein
MNCALCREDRPLQWSHIIPEFMYRPLYDQNHRFYGVSSFPERPKRFFKKGVREKLLCGLCEQQFSRYENYACSVFFGSAASVPTRIPTGLLFRGLNYDPLKLFFMSLLWRLAVTKIEYLKGADLGPHVEPLRILLHAEDPNDYRNFGCMVTALKWEGKHITDLIIPPVYTRFEQRRVWAVVITGFLFNFFVSNQKPPRQSWPGLLQMNGDFPLHVSEVREVRFLTQWISEIGKAERARQSQKSGSMASSERTQNT